MQYGRTTPISSNSSTLPLGGHLVAPRPRDHRSSDPQALALTDTNRQHNQIFRKNPCAYGIRQISMLAVRTACKTPIIEAAPTQLSELYVLNETGCSSTGKSSVQDSFTKSGQTSDIFVTSQLLVFLIFGIGARYFPRVP
jgi:hypothetical protein